jgi:hypothetical protein
MADAGACAGEDNEVLTLRKHQQQPCTAEVTSYVGAACSSPERNLLHSKTRHIITH